MTKHEFLKELKRELEQNQVQKIDDILSDYDEHFNHAATKGKSENDISEALGSPATIAKAYKAETMIQEIKNPNSPFRWSLALNVLLRLLVLAPFNFFFLFIPGLIILTFLTIGWSVAIAIGSVGFALLWKIPAIASIAATFWLWLAGLSATIGLIGLSCVGFLIMFFITKYIVLGLIGYLQWNLKFVTEK